MSDALTADTQLDSNQQVKSPNATEPNGHKFPHSNGIAGDDASADSPATPASVVTHSKTPLDGEALSVEVEMQKSDSLSAVQPGDSTDQVAPINQPNHLPSPPLDNGVVDVHMSESNGPNIIDGGENSPMGALKIHSPPNMEVDEAPTNGMQYPDDETTNPPPAKRVRKHSDADQASFAHSAIASSSVPANSAGTSTSAPSLPTPNSDVATTPQSTLSTAQFRFAQGTLRTLKKLKDAAPFLRPVDPIALNIPHYPNIIKTPMDFSTIERKLTSSNPAKPDPNIQNPRYYSADAFISDVRLIFHNCLTFNGPDHAVTAMGKRVEEVFDKQLKQMPPSLELKPAPIPKPATPPPPSAALKKQPLRRPSTSVPVIRRSDTEAAIGRPKREIHPPPPKDLPYADAPKKPRRNKRVKDDGTSEQLKYCAKLLTELHRKQHYGCAHPFYEPVDWQKLEIPSYPKVVKKPMDLSTMRKKLDNREYANAQKFYDDFKLMIRNCFAFNPAGTPVNQAGIELQRLFDDKWRHLPPLHEISDDDHDDADEDDSEADRIRAIADMESQIETMRGSIAALKKPAKKEKKHKDKGKGSLGSSKLGKGSKGGVAGGKKKGKNKPVADDDVLTFEQKKDLSEAIQQLDGTKLERVIQIIHEGVPEIRDSTEEIELEIDLLPATVLTKLYNFVLRPLRTPAVKRNRNSKGTGTGGLKRKSMDEDVEAEKIRRLEERMKMFETGGTGLQRDVVRDDDSEESSTSGGSSPSDSE